MSNRKYELQAEITTLEAKVKAGEAAATAISYRIMNSPTFYQPRGQVNLNKALAEERKIKETLEIDRNHLMELKLR